MLQMRVVSVQCPGYSTRLVFVPPLLAHSIDPGEIPAFQGIRVQPLKIFKHFQNKITDFAWKSVTEQGSPHSTAWSHSKINSAPCCQG